MAWTHRVENIRRRDWSDLLDHWAEFGDGFDTAEYRAGDLEQSIEALVAPSSLAGNNVCIVEFDQRAAFLSELVFSQVKANHAFICAVERIVAGSATWGVTDAYHASMLLMRSILAAFGIFICRVHERNVLIDAFPWLGRIDDQKRFKQKNKNWNRCAAVISCVIKDFAQADLYTLFQRAINVSAVPPDTWPEVIVQNILKTHKTHFSSHRNQLIYGSRFWFNYDDLLGECLSLQWTSLPPRSISAYAFTKAGTATEIDCYCDCWVLFLMSYRLHATIYRSFVDSLRVFDYVDARGADFSLIEKQFFDQL